MNQFQPRVFSGVQPTGNLHLGNYLGAISRFVPLQDEMPTIYCVVDMHAITVKHDPAALTVATREVTAAYLAAGIDPKKAIIFNQSQVREHAELAWIFNCIARMGLAEPHDPVQGEGGQEPGERVRRAVRLSDADGGRHPCLPGDPCAGWR